MIRRRSGKIITAPPGSATLGLVLLERPFYLKVRPETKLEKSARCVGRKCSHDESLRLVLVDRKTSDLREREQNGTVVRMGYM